MTKKELEIKCNVLAKEIWDKNLSHIKKCEIDNLYYLNLGFHKGYRQTLRQNRQGEIVYIPYWVGYDYKETWQEVFDLLSDILNGKKVIKDE